MPVSWSYSNEGGDIAIRFNGISSRLTIPWRDFIHSSQSIMLFGLPLLQGWPFAALFWKKKHQHAHHIFRQFSSEYFGDSRACSMLYIEYQQARLDSTSADLLSHDNKPSSETNIFNESLFNREDVRQFQKWVDWYCKYALVNCMHHYNDYSQPLILPEDFTNYFELSKNIFPQQWSFLQSTRGIQSRDGNVLQEYKEWQIFMVLLNLQRLANFRVLKHWAMVILTTFYGWGAKDTIAHVTKFLGITVAWKSRNAFF